MTKIVCMIMVHVFALVPSLCCTQEAVVAMKDTSVQAGDTGVAIQLTLDNRSAGAVAGGEIHIAYDNEAIQMQECTQTIRSENIDFFLCGEQPYGMRLLFTGYGYSIAPDSGSIAEFVFDIAGWASGEYSMNITDAVLTNSLGAEIPVSTRGCTLSVQGHGCVPPFITPSEAYGSKGDSIIVDVIIEQNQNPVGEFRFDVSFDAFMLSFLDVEPGDLSIGPEWIEGSLIRRGLIGVEGYYATLIPSQSSGSLIKLIFEVEYASAESGAESPLCVDRVYDDLVGVNPCCGSFQYISRCSEADINCDGHISPGDALCCFWRSLSMEFPSECRCECSESVSDVNCDGDITPADALCIFWRSILGDWTEECRCPTVKTITAPSASQILTGNMKHAGQTVTIPLMVENPEHLDAFRLRMSYPDDALDFVGVNATDATENWIALEGTEPEGGLIALGGFHSEPISSDGLVSLAELIFNVKKTDVHDLSLDLVEATDDLAGVPFSRGSSMVSHIPTAYALRENYPNPFNPVTTIEYTLPEVSRVTLTIYNVLGQSVEVLIDSERKAGYHMVQWDASNIASGIYLYRLEAGDFTQTKRMVLLR